MAFDKFPRPSNDSGYGFHLGTGEPDYSPASRDFWLAELGALGASWLVVSGTPDRPVPVEFARALVEHDIEPIVRLDVWPILPVEQPTLAALCRSYADAGVHYLHLFREPNLATQWTIADWIAPGLVDRFGQILLPSLETIRGNGLVPLLSPLAPGGHYWDLTFLDQLLLVLLRDASSSLLDDLGVCIHHYPTNRPLAWGAGGAARWPLARPYAPAEAGDDHRGFRLFEWYDEVIRGHLGRSLPLFSGETGPVLGTRDHLLFPRIDEEAHQARAQEIAALAGDKALPPYLFNVAFWTLTASPADPIDTHAWYRRDGTRIPAVDALKAWVAARATSAALAPPTLREPSRIEFSPREPAVAPATSDLDVELPTPEPPARSAAERPIRRYILFELTNLEPRELAAYLGALLPFAARSQATLGFRREEARLAERVTVVGADAVLLIRAQRELQLQGCQVDLLHASTPDDLRQALVAVA
ncbi:MAG TPA: hypothetical protein VFZ25_07260 [Chloroflexota bacterium]|nr:hypothetical protein [Chloroflexota bacterium]